MTDMVRAAIRCKAGQTTNYTERKMKLTSIQVRDFLGARAIDVQLATPVTIFAGKNFAGKSSLQEAVRMALTGESVRVALKKDFGQLVSEGATSGYATVETDDGTYSVVLPAGKGEHSDNASLPFVLDAQRFARLGANERRGFLFGLMGLSASGKAVQAKLLGKGCDEKLVGAVMPLLRAGFDTACKEAQAKARDAKAAWRALTGETYGEKKAEGWAAPVPEAAPAWTGKPLADIEGEISELTGAVGALQERERAHTAQAEKLASTKEKSARLARVTEKLKVDTAARDEWLVTVQQTRDAARGASAHAMACPECAAMLELRDGALHPHTALADDPEAAAKLPEYEKALVLLENAVKNGERDLADCKAAAELLKSLGAAEAFAPEELRAKRAALAVAQANRSAAKAADDQRRAAERAAAGAADITAKAGQHHADVLGWSKVADALAPDGIPGELLAEALAPINDRLEQSSDDALWLHAHIEPDMSIWAAYPEQPVRPYSALSESEQWRVDAMIAEAIAHLSGVKLLVLDRFDVLDLPGRGDLVAWLDILAADGELDTALIFGTMKAAPTGLTVNVSTHWIESGVVGQLKEAA